MSRPLCVRWEVGRDTVRVVTGVALRGRGCDILLKYSVDNNFPRGNSVGGGTNKGKQALVSGLPWALVMMPFGDPRVVDPRLIHPLGRGSLLSC